MAGMRTVEELLKIAPDIYDITVFGDEPYPNYNPVSYTHLDVYKRQDSRSELIRSYM